jgi:hypothetical protein
VDQSGGRCSEPASIEVEWLQARVEVDVEPFATRCLGVPGGKLDQASPDTSVLEGSMRLRIEQESVVSAIPGDVRKANDRPISRVGRDPAETVGADLIPPALDGPSAVRTDQADHLAVCQRATPAVRDPVEAYLSFQSELLARALRLELRLRSLGQLAGSAGVLKDSRVSGAHLCALSFGQLLLRHRPLPNGARFSRALRRCCSR